jgi:hypothetical protein
MSGVFDWGKRVIRKAGQFLGAPGGPFEEGVYNPQYPAPWAYPLAEQYTKDIGTYLPRLDTLQPYGQKLIGYGEKAAGTANEENYLKQVQNFVNAGMGPNNALWNLTSKRYMNELTPRFSGAGVLTSGPGLNAMSQGMEDLAIKFGEAERARQAGELGLLGTATGQLKGAETAGVSSYAAALEGLKALETLPIDVRRKLIEALFGQKGETPQLSPSQLQQLGGGGGLGNLITAL